MHKRINVLLSFIILVNALVAQISNDSANKYNDNHKKNGLWEVYLNEFTNPTGKDKAIFIGYELYDNGECVYPFTKYKVKKYTVVFEGKKGTTSAPVLLNGNIKFLYPSGKVAYEGQYRNGRPVYLNAFNYDKQGNCTMKELLDFANTYNNIDGTFYYQYFGPGNKLYKRGYYRKGDKGWRVYDDKL
ncbi:MAG: hypothetical protein K0S33_1752 [Bacteroidetes bacterium]|jgi:hypothetical protein|nr:hypothetical protein [Bacteroidota bacterium]